MLSIHTLNLFELNTETASSRASCANPVELTKNEDGKAQGQGGKAIPKHTHIIDGYPARRREVQEAINGRA